MFLFMPTMWWASSALDAPAKKTAASPAPLWPGDNGGKQDLSSLLDKISPDFLVTVTRSALLAMTTSLSRVSGRVYGACQQLNQVLAFDRMARTMFPWASPTCDPFDFSGLGSWFTGAAFGRTSSIPASFPFSPFLWWADFCQPAPAAAANPWSSFMIWR